MNDAFFLVYPEAIKGGFMRELGKERWLLLTALSSYMDEDGKCYPTQEQLAKDLGVARQSVNKTLKLLTEFKWNGKHILTVEQHGKGFKKNNVYTIKAEPFICKFNDKEGPLYVQEDTETSSVYATADTNNTTAIYNAKETVITTAKEVVTYFAQKYREHYNVNYSINWKRDMNLGKKLLEAFPGRVKDILDVVFAEFEDRWKRDKYPRPSLGAIVSWMGNDALALVEQVRAREARLEAAEQEQPQDVEAIMARLNRKKV